MVRHDIPEHSEGSDFPLEIPLIAECQLWTF